jgi:hypothetical protein
VSTGDNSPVGEHLKTSAAITAEFLLISAEFVPELIFKTAEFYNFSRIL